MKNPKDYPIAVLNLLQIMSGKVGANIEKSYPENVYIKFKDTDVFSKFYFEVSNYKIMADGSGRYLVNHCPKNEHAVETVTFYRKTIEEVESDFSKWKLLLDVYDTIPNPFETIDPIEKQYEEEYFAEFEIIDDDAETSTFSYAQQLRIDEYLEKVLLQLDEAKDATNSEAIEEIKHNITELKATQTNLTKKEVVRKIAKIWAKARKAGIKVAKKVIDETIKEGVKLLVKGTLDGSLIEKASQLLS